MGMLNKAKKEAPTAAPEQEPPAADAGSDEAAAPPDAGQEPEGDEGPSPTAPSDDDGDESDSGGGGEDMPPALQPEYKRCVAALYEIMYNNDTTSRHVLDSLDHTSDQGKVESVARTTMLLFHLIDKKLNVSGPVVPYVLLTIADRLIELLERVHKLKFSEKEIMVTCAAVFEGAKQLIPNSQNPTAGAPDASPAAAPGADASAPPAGGADAAGGGAAPGSVPPGTNQPAPEPAAAPQAQPTEEEAAQ